MDWNRLGLSLQRLAQNLLENRRDFLVLAVELFSPEPGYHRQSDQRPQQFLYVIFNSGNTNGVFQETIFEKGADRFLRHTIQGEPFGQAHQPDIHELVLPLRIQAKDVAITRNNLWLIDDRLTFHQHLHSDRPISKSTEKVVDSSLEPDLIAYNFPASFGDKTSGLVHSVSMVEFKRPERGSYTFDDNPVQQVVKYADALRNERTANVQGRTIDIPDDVPIFAYIFCDIAVENFERIMGQMDMKKNPDGMGYSSYKESLKLHVSVWSLDKLLDDAKLRNQTLFEQLNLPIG